MSVQTDGGITPLRAWVAATRPATLWAAIGPVGLGVALAVRDGHRAPVVAAAALLTALLLQIGANLANDYFDGARGTDGPDRLGPARAVASGWLTLEQVGWATALVLAGAAASGIVLVIAGGWPIAALGLASILCALAYTAGPLPLAYVGLGEPAVALFFGPVAVVGAYYVVAGSLTTAPWIAAIGPGALITAILVVNNLRDRHTDARAHKRTLAVRLGARATRLEYTALLVLPFIVPPVAWLGGERGLGWWSVYGASPLALRCLRGVWRDDARALNPWLGRTAQLSFVYCALLSVGVLLWP
ncbi:MAG: 1,4-dihydroxy-2-naphthoate polyprenyltransferase [Proteobacteria bacterium]|nr:MAG: 1,4-dihydroxy-2-naphthoate polyprenyltransferase [Pseudomonadota bacterium]PIE19480.1 MAG: 1,4-dihydroxy-2-naphthoate polyprenyltransferase [Pseudomonadota bacterium]